MTFSPAITLLFFQLIACDVVAVFGHGIGRNTFILDVVLVLLKSCLKVAGFPDVDVRTVSTRDDVHNTRELFFFQEGSLHARVRAGASGMGHVQPARHKTVELVQGIVSYNTY